MSSTAPTTLTALKASLSTLKKEGPPPATPKPAPHADAQLPAGKPAATAAAAAIPTTLAGWWEFLAAQLEAGKAPCKHLLNHYRLATECLDHESLAKDERYTQIWLEYARIQMSVLACVWPCSLPDLHPYRIKCSAGLPLLASRVGWVPQEVTQSRGSLRLHKVYVERGSRCPRRKLCAAAAVMCRLSRPPAASPLPQTLAGYRETLPPLLHHLGLTGGRARCAAQEQGHAGTLAHCAGWLCRQREQEHRGSTERKRGRETQPRNRNPRSQVAVSRPQRPHPSRACRPDLYCCSFQAVLKEPGPDCPICRSSKTTRHSGAACDLGLGITDSLLAHAQTIPFCLAMTMVWGWGWGWVASLLCYMV